MVIFIYCVCVPIHGMVKNIAIMDEVYAELVKHKRHGESFSHEIIRFIGRKGHIADLAGSWKISDAEAARIKSAIRTLRTQTTKKLFAKLGVKK